MPSIQWDYENEDGEFESVDFPANWHICDNCKGNGTHDHPAFSSGITSSEWNSWDDDDRDHYMSGRYDVLCEECKGSGKILLVDSDYIEESKNTELKKMWAKKQRADRAQAEHLSICAWERKMGA